jgi:hypothetical protein
VNKSICIFGVLLFLGFYSASAQNDQSPDACNSPPTELLDCTPKQDCSQYDAPRGDPSRASYYAAQKSFCQAIVAKQQEDCLATNGALRAAAQRCIFKEEVTGSLWNNNGSIVRLVSEGQTRKFIIELPRAGLTDAGLQPGQVVFDGIRDGGSYSGTAYVFSKRCGTLAFKVQGPVSADQQQVALYGNRPSVDPNCRVVSSQKDVFVFSRVGN